jgi:hypothetical protein
MPRKDGTATPLDLIHWLAKSNGLRCASCRSCQYLEPTGERDYGWCAVDDHPQFEHGVCLYWEPKMKTPG